MSFDPTPQDYVAASKLCFRHQLIRPRFRQRTLMLVAAASLIGVLVGIVLGDDLMSAAIVAGAGALGGIAFLMVIIGGSYLLLPRRSRRLFAQDRSMAHTTRFQWDDAGTRWESQIGSFQSTWDDHHDWAQSREVILIFANDQLYRFLPGRTLTTGQRDEIVMRLEASRQRA